MRKLFSVLSVALVALFAVGCENNPEGGNTGVSFTFQNVKTTTSSVEVQVVPSDAATLYFAAITEAAELAGLNDAAIITKFTDAQDVSFTKGNKTLTATNLTPDTEYVAVAFDINATDKVARYSLKTLPIQDPIPSEEFEVEINVSNIEATSAVATAILPLKVT